MNMRLLDQIKSWFASDDELVARNVAVTDMSSAVTTFTVPEKMDAVSILAALQKYGRESGYELLQDVEQHKTSAFMSSVKTQVAVLHDEIARYYSRKQLNPDNKKLNLLTVVNIFYVAMGTAVLTKVKRSNLIAQGLFRKLLLKSGPELFYREVAAMAGNKYGDADVEALHQHVQRAAYLLLTECDRHPETLPMAMECGKAMYVYGLCISLK